MRRAARVVLFFAGAFVVIVATVSVALILPGIPSDARSLRFQGFVPLPGKGLVQVLDYLNVYERQLFVTNVSTGDVYRIILRSKTLPSPADISAFESEPAAHGVVVDPAGGMGFVTRSGTNVVDAFDPARMRSIRRIAVADDPDAILYDPMHRLVYAANGDSMVATLIDPAKLKTVATIPLGGSPEFAVFDGRTGLIYQNLSSTNAVAAVNVATRAIVWRHPLNDCELPTGMAIDESDRRLFIACGKSASLVIFDLIRRRIIASVPIGIGPDSVAYDAQLHRIYTTGLMGTLSVIQQDTADAYHVSDTIRLHFNAHTLAIDPLTHNLFVGYTGFVFQPKLAVFSPSR
jgi:YVTN family beta-propeller protein